MMKVTRLYRNLVTFFECFPILMSVTRQLKKRDIELLATRVIQPETFEIYFLTKSS